MHSVGETLEELVRIARGAGERPFFGERDQGFISTTISRLKDTRAYGPWNMPVRSDSYGDAVELAQDLAKLSTPAGLGGDAPEFASNYHRAIRVPLADPIPLSDRLEQIIDHPLFQRLGIVTQLGVVNLVFRSANHTRFEHSLGVLASSIQYLRALWYSPTAAILGRL